MEATLDLPVPRPVAISSRSRWTGRILTALPALFLAFDAIAKLANASQVVEASQRIGMPVDVAPVLGVVLLACLALYLAPRTAVLGAVLLTGYLGGAVAMHVRIGDPLGSHVLFPVYFGAVLWAGLYLRDARVRALFH